jgi:ribosomal protein S12 methylthiotransferase accessory factor
MNAIGAAKTFRSGTHRTMAPDETLRRGLRFAPVMGITRIANVTGLDSIGIPVVMVCRPNSRSLAVSQGKGLDLVAAKASGLMESIETYHAETITFPLRLCSYEEIRYEHRAVDVWRLPATSKSAFNPNSRILWCEGHDLVNEEPVWVPYDLVHTDYTWPQPAGSGCFASTSNGLASGNHVLEAISHAICEVVERDATTLWRIQDATARDSSRVDPATVDDPACTQTLELIERAGLATAVWETTSDIGIASFICVLYSPQDEPARKIPPAIGSGAHPARSVALLRALTEAAQGRLTQIAGSRDDAGRNRYGDHRYALTLDGLRRPRAAATARSFRNAPDWDSDSFESDVAWELDRLRHVGVDRVIVVDLTKDAFKIPVVRVIIPGLEGLNEVPGYVPGKRAREVAVGNR